MLTELQEIIGTNWPIINNGENPMRLVETIVGTAATSKVYYNYDWNEYVVKFFSYSNHIQPKLIHDKDADYHTDELQDAVDTATLVAKGN